MSSILSPEEKKVTQKLLNDGYANSANSFSSIAQQKVKIEATDLEVTAIDESTFSEFTDESNLYVLTTDIIGDMSGKSYLIFKNFEANEIFEKCLPKSKSDPEARKTMEDAILMEIDNMLAAAVITQFSNALNIKMYGGVPRLEIMDYIKLYDFITDDLNQSEKGEKSNLYLMSNTKFIFENNSEMRPHFMWVLPQAFLEAVKEKCISK